MKDKKCITKDLPPLILYLEDLEELVKILKNIGKRVEIDTPEYKITNLTELRQIYKNKPISSLEFKIFNPYFSISLSKYYPRLYISPGNVKNLGLISEIYEFLLERKNIFRTIIKKIYYPLTIIGGLTVGLQINSVNSRPEAIRLLITFLITCLIIILGAPGNNIKIVLQKRSSLPFWKRHSVAIGLIIGLLGIILAALELIIH